MTGKNTKKRFMVPVLGLSWVAAVLVAYHAANTAYYLEKISTFARFLVSSP